MPSPRFIAVALLSLFALHLKLSALDVPSGVVALPLAAGDHERLSCGGAAVVINADGSALTLAEALPTGDATTITVVCPGGIRRQATIVRRGTTTTAVLLHIANLPANVQPLPLGDERTLNLGAEIWTAGNTVGALEDDGAAALSCGTLSARYELSADEPPVRGRGGRVLSTYRGPVLEVDAGVNDGNQGGALLDAHGALVGLVSLGESRSRRLGTAVPITRVLADLGVPVPTQPTASAPALATVDAVLDHARASLALIAFARPNGLGNPGGEGVIERPPRTVDEAPTYDRERLQKWWDAYYHQQQLYYTDAPVPALVVDARNGLLLTALGNLHGGATEGRVLLPGGGVACTVVGTSAAFDVALIKAAQPLPLADVVFAAEGAEVPAPVRVVAGYPGAERGLTVTAGIASTIARQRDRDVPLLQIDATVDLASLGGAVIDAAGDCLGLVVMMGPRSDWPWFINSGVGFAVDAATIRRLLPLLAAGKDVEPPARPKLGIELRGNGQALVVAKVFPGTGAADAGVKIGDVLETIDGQPVSERGVLARAMFRRVPGDRVQLGLLRGERPLTLTLEVRVPPNGNGSDVDTSSTITPKPSVKSTPKSPVRKTPKPSAQPNGDDPP